MIDYTNKKFCWLARETKNGWKLSFEVGNKSFHILPGIYFASMAMVKKAMKGKIVFIHKD